MPILCAMLLSDWLARKGITRMKFAEDIGVSPSVITDLCSGKIFLSRTVARSIERETQGEVTANDFVHLGASPEQAAD